MIPIEDVRADSSVKNDPFVKEELQFLFQEEAGNTIYYIFIAVAILVFQVFPRYNPLIKGIALFLLFMAVKFFYPSIL